MAMSKRAKAEAERERDSRSKKVKEADKLLGGKTKKVATKTGGTEKLPPLPKKLVIPKTLAQVADMLYTVQKNRYKLQNELKPLAEFETQLREHLIQNLPKSQANGIAGKLARVTRKEKEVPTLPEDGMAAFMKYAHRKGNEDLVTEKPNFKAIEERWEAGKTVPGVKPFKVITISLNKL